MSLKIIVLRKDTHPNQFLLQDIYKVEKIFWIRIPNVIYSVRRDRQSIFSILLFWYSCHNSFYPFYNIIYISKIPLTIPIIEKLNCLVITQFISKIKVSHIWASSRSIY